MRITRLMKALPVILLFSMEGFSQTAPSLWAEVRSPMLNGKDSIAKNYNGVYDFGFGYNFLNYSKITLGVGFNAAYFRYIPNGGITYSYQGGYLYLFTTTLQINYIYPITHRLSLIPKVGFGISFYKAYEEQIRSGTASSTTQEPWESYKVNNSGFSVRGELWLAYAVNQNLSIAAIAGYDFYQSSSWKSRRFNYDNASQIFSPGIGIILRLKKGLFSADATKYSLGRFKNGPGVCSPF